MKESSVAELRKGLNACCKASKLGHSSIYFHPRILALQDGFLKYYRQIPPKWEDGSWSLLTNLKPKAGVNVNNCIVEQAPGEEKKKRKRSFLLYIIFPAEEQLVFGNESEDKNQGFVPHDKLGNIAYATTTIDDTGTSENVLREKIKKKAVKWLWSFDSSEEMTKWEDLIIRHKNPEKYMNPQLKTEEEMEKELKPSNEAWVMGKDPSAWVDSSGNMEDQLVLDEDEGNSKSNDVIMEEIEAARKKHAERMKIKQNEEKNKIASMQEAMKKEQEEKMKKAMELRKEEENKLKNMERSKYDEKIAKLQNEWDFKYLNALDDTINSKNINETLKNDLQFCKFVGLFRTRCAQVVKEIIDELHLPIDYRKYTPHSIDYAENTKPGVTEAPIKMVFDTPEDSGAKVDPNASNFNLTIVLTWPQTESKEVFLEDEERKTETMYYADRIKKTMANEFRHNDVVMDAILAELKRDNTFKIRVPLKCFVVYKGCDALVTAKPPIIKGSLIMGLNSSGVYQQRPELSTELMKIGKILNIKDHKYDWDQRLAAVKIPLSAHVEAHALYKRELDDVLKGTNTTTSGTANIKNAKSIIYLSHLEDLFPVELDVENNDLSYTHNKLRPEFVQEYSKPLSPDAFFNMIETPETEREEIEVVHACKLLVQENLQLLKKHLDELYLLPIDSATLSQAFHSHGVNMRFLGRLAEIVELPHNREICIVEMIARASKKIYAKYIGDMIFQFEKNTREVYAKELDPKGMKKNAQIRNEFKSQLNDQFSEDVTELVLDFLNLLFGQGHETDIFWNDILANQVRENFGYNILTISKNEIHPGLLVNAVIYHTQINMDFNEEIQVFKTRNPVVRSSTLNFKMKTRVYSFRQLELKILSERYRDFIKLEQYDAALKSATIKSHVDQSLACQTNMKEVFFVDNVYTGVYKGDPILFGELAEICLAIGNLDMAYENAISGVDAVHKLHAETVKCWCALIRVHMARKDFNIGLECFNKAVKVIEYHLGEYHPLFSTLYGIFGNLYAEIKQYDDALMLFKSSLVCCLRSLGANHSFTAQNYEDIAMIFLKMDKKEESFQHLEKAFLINEATEGRISLKCGGLSLKLGVLCFSQGRFKESINYSNISIQIWRKLGEEKNNTKIIDCLLTLCQCHEQQQNYEKVIDTLNQCWYQLSNYGFSSSKQKNECLEKLFRIAFKTICSGLTVEKKSLLFRLFDAIAEELQRSNYMLKDIREGIEEKKEENLRLLLSRCIENKNITNYIKTTSNILVGSMQEIYEKNIFTSFYQGLEKISDKYLKEALEDYEKILRVLGADFFYNLLR